MEWSLAPGDTAAVPKLRREMVDHLRRDAAPDADLDSAELVIAELLSNVVAHTRGARISLRWDSGHPKLRVADTGPIPVAGAGVVRSVPAQQIPADLPTDPFATGGRGMYLISELALTVDVASRAGGTVVQVTLPVEHA